MKHKLDAVLGSVLMMLGTYNLTEDSGWVTALDWVGVFVGYALMVMGMA